MQAKSSITAADLFGVFELDSSGTVLYYGARDKSRQLESKTNLIGRNFFEEITAFENAPEFQRRFKRFINDSAATENFDFSFQTREKVTKAKVMMLHVRERDFDKNANLVIVDIRET